MKENESRTFTLAQALQLHCRITQYHTIFLMLPGQIALKGPHVAKTSNKSLWSLLLRRKHTLRCLTVNHHSWIQISVDTQSNLANSPATSSQLSQCNKVQRGPMEFVSMQPEEQVWNKCTGRVLGQKVAVFLLSPFAEACLTYRDHRYRGLYMFLRLQNIKQNSTLGLVALAFTQYLARKQAVVARALNILNRQPMLMLIQYSWYGYKV